MSTNSTGPEFNDRENLQWLYIILTTTRFELKIAGLELKIT
jgi:hypothetical protein